MLKGGKHMNMDNIVYSLHSFPLDSVLPILMGHLLCPRVLSDSMGGEKGGEKSSEMTK